MCIIYVLYNNVDPIVNLYESILKEEKKLLIIICNGECLDPAMLLLLLSICYSESMAERFIRYIEYIKYKHQNVYNHVLYTTYTGFMDKICSEIYT